MDISPSHSAAVLAAIAIPALAARLELLVGTAEERATIRIYGTERPAPGEDPGGAHLVEIPFSERAGVLDEEELEVVIDVPMEGQITGADPATGTIPVWGRVWGPGPAPAGWGDVSVGVTGSGAEVEMAATTEEGEPPVPTARMYQGAFSRILGFVIDGGGV